MKRKEYIFYLLVGAVIFVIFIKANLAKSVYSNNGVYLGRFVDKYFNEYTKKEVYQFEARNGLGGEIPVKEAYLKSQLFYKF